METELDRRQLLLNTAGAAAGLVINDLFRRLEQTQKITAGPPYIGFDTAWISAHYIDRPDDASGLPDAKQMRRDGVAFHFAKAGEGVDYNDRFFAESRENAASAEILFGAYQFLRAGRGREQAQAAYERLRATGGTKGLVNIIDVELSPSGAPSPNYSDILSYWSEFTRLVPHAPLLIYTSGEYWNNRYLLGRSLPQPPPPAPPNSQLWWASYYTPKGSRRAVQGDAFAISRFATPPGAPDDPYPRRQVADWKEYAIRQFTDQAHYQDFNGQDRGNGHKRTIDCNVSFRPWKDLLALAGLELGDLPHPRRQ